MRFSRRSGRYEDPDTEVIIRSRLSVLDLVVESLGGLLARPSRMLLTALGTVLGIAALVATLGLAKTAGSQIVSRFDPLAASQVVVVPNDRSLFGPEAQASTIPWDAEARLVRLNGVVAAGTKPHLAGL
jgi:putative ABC transport system permease protein